MKKYSGGLDKAVQYVHSKWGSKKNYLFYFDAIINSSCACNGLPRFYLLLKNLEIVGLRPAESVRSLARLQGVQITGFVEDITEKLWESTLTVVPLRLGGGTRLKILEALASECPVVSTKTGAEGLDMEHGKHLILADSAGEFAETIIDLLESPEMRANLAREGRQLVLDVYDWRKIAPRLEFAIQEAIRLS